MSGWTAETLRSHVGEWIDTDRERTPLEVKAYGGPGVEGGSGVLVDAFEGRCVQRHHDVVVDFGVVPHVVVDYGMSWAILPGTKVTFAAAQPAPNGGTS